MARRTGLTTLRALTYQICRLIVKWSPTIKTVYPSSTALHVALETASVACETLLEEIDDTLPTGV